jgi:hypothetical protein
MAVGTLAEIVRLSGVVNVRDQVIPILGLLETTESHLGTWDVLLRVF